MTDQEKPANPECDCGSKTGFHSIHCWAWENQEWMCNYCDFKAVDFYDMFRHIHAKHRLLGWEAM